MDEFNCLSQDITVSGHYFLEASAGTGKTFAIEHIALRLIAEHGYALEQILAVTFTKAAMRDLRQRITKALTAAMAAFTNGTYASAYPFLRPEHEPLLQKALREIDALEVYTLHGFCYEVLSENALTIDFPLSEGREEGFSSMRQMKGIVREYLRSYPSHNRGSVSSVQLTRLLKHYRNDVELFETALLSLAEGNGALPSALSIQDYEEKITTFLSTIDIVALEEEVLAAAPFYKVLDKRGALSEKWKQQLDFLKNGKNLRETAGWETLFSANFTEENRSKKKKEAPPPTPILDKFGTFWNPLHGMVTRKGNILALLAGELRNFIQRAQQEKDLLSPDSLLETMKKALQNPSFVRAVQQKYKALIIDEFQDTDPLQWEIFSTLFFTDDYKIDTLYVVGDPKQSIYSFRSADLYTYMGVKALLGEKSVKVLKTNYRSSPSVIEGLNALFGHEKLTGWLSLPRENSFLPYLNVKPGKEPSNALSDGKKGVHFFLAESNQPLTATTLQEKEHSCFLPAIAAEILKLPINLSVAILVRDRYQARRVKEALSTVGIYSQTHERGSLLDSPVFSLCTLLVSIINNPFSYGEILQVAAHPLIGLRESDLEGDGWTLLQTLFQKAHANLLQKGRTFALDVLSMESILGSSLIERLLQHGGDEAFEEYEYILQLLSDGYRIEDIIHDENVNEKKPCKAKSQGVSIMTMHMSKGLEFDIVFALGILSKHKTKELLLRIDNSFVVRESDDPRCKTALHEANAEKLRQLYVALTRAKERIYIPYIQAPSDDEYASASPIELLLGKQSSEIFASLETVASFEVLQEKKLPEHKKMEKRHTEVEILDTSHVLRKRALSFSALHRKTASPLEITVEKGALPAGPATGTCIHEIFQTCFEKALHYPYQKEHLREKIVQKTKNTQFAPHTAEIHTLIDNALTHSYTCNHETFTLLDIPPEHILTELEFMYAEEGNVYKGIIDLLFYRNGKWFIVDWKTNLLPSYDQTALDEAMEQQGYFLQAEMYAKATRKMLQKPNNTHPLELAGAYYCFVRGMGEGKGVYFYES